MLGKIEGRGEGDDRGWDGWMASPTQWIWVWVNCGRWRWTGKPGVLQSSGFQSRTRLSDWTTITMWDPEDRDLPVFLTALSPGPETELGLAYSRHLINNTASLYCQTFSRIHWNEAEGNSICHVITILILIILCSTYRPGWCGQNNQGCSKTFNNFYLTMEINMEFPHFVEKVDEVL